MSRMRSMVGCAGDAWLPPTAGVRERPQVQHKGSAGQAPIDWPFPTYKGVPLAPPARETRKQRLNKLEDALL